MVRSLQEYVTETTKSYEPAKQAIQEQLNAVSGQLAEAEKNINAQFAVQQDTLNQQRQTAASNASMQAAGSGGSFGGRANIANRNFYRDTYVPAVTQLQTNQSQSLSEARTSSENKRLSLASQLANLMTQANTSALTRYDADAQQERQLELQRQQLEEQQRQFNENLAWEKAKLDKQLADSAASRAATTAANNSLSQYIKELNSAGQGSSNLSQYYGSSSVPSNPSLSTTSTNLLSSAKLAANFLTDPSVSRKITQDLGYCPKDISKYVNQYIEIQQGKRTKYTQI